MKKVIMIVPSFSAKGGISSVVNGYRGSELEKKYKIKYIESYCDGSRLKKIIKAIVAYFSFFKEMIMNKPDVVHIHSSFGGSFYRKLPFIYSAFLFGIPIINHLHGADFEAFYLNSSNKKKRLVIKTYEKCTKIVVLSEEWKKKISLIVPETKIFVIENYSFINNSIIERRINKNNQNTVLFLGFICKRKGCFDIPAIVKKVAKVIPSVKFIIAGDGEIKALKQLIDPSIRENIVFPGWVRDSKKEKYLYAADVFFLPSYNEGMPMCILDAMGCGLPIVSTTVGGISKIVWYGENGFIHQPGSNEDMANSIIKLLTNEKMRREFGDKSVEIAKKYFSLEKHIEKVGHLYEKAMNAGIK